MLRRTLFLVYLFFLGAVEASSAQTDTSLTRRGTWSAANTGDLRLMGTWTAILDSTGRTVTGTWMVSDAQGKTLANGGWSAAKSPTGWTGAWRANVAGKSGEYSGTWSAGADLKGDARFDDLFEKAVQAIVSGTWRAGKESGAWSIRAAKRETP